MRPSHSPVVCGGHCCERAPARAQRVCLEAPLLIVAGRRGANSGHGCGLGCGYRGWRSYGGCGVFGDFLDHFAD